MTKKLKYRIALTIFIITTVFLVLAIVAVNVMFMISQRRQVENRLRMAIMKSDLSSITTPPGDIVGEDSEMLLGESVVVVGFDENNNVIKIEYDSKDEDRDDRLITQMAIVAIGMGEGKGIVGDKGQYRFIVEKGINGPVVALFDRSVESAVFARITGDSFLVFMCFESVFAVVSYFLARYLVKPAEAAWGNQSQFVADASHELKTPMTVISTNIDVVLSNSGETVESQRKWLENIKDETRRMSALVSDLVYLAKNDAKRINNEKKNYNLGEAVMGQCLAFEPIVYESSRSLATDIKDDIVISGNEDKIKQLMYILLDNAVKYSSSNSQITVTCKRDLMRRPVIEVTNMGTPIPKEHHKKIFNRFYRVDPSHNKETGGSGLGLAIAKTIAQSQGGDIHLTTGENSNTFTVVL